MPGEIYSVLSTGMRYWFALLGVLIVWRSFHWLRRDRKETHRRLKRLPDAGNIGVFRVLAGGPQLAEGEELPVPREGVLGSVRTCDIALPVSEVRKRHLDFFYVDGQGLHVQPRRGCACSVDGVELTHRSGRQSPLLTHGSILQAGDALLRLYLFEGLEVPRSARLMSVELPDPPSAGELAAPQNGNVQTPNGNAAPGSLPYWAYPVPPQGGEQR